MINKVKFGIFFDYSVKSNCLFFCDAKIPNIIFKSSWLNISELICEMASEKSRSIPIVSKLFKRLSQENNFSRLDLRFDMVHDRK